VRIGIVSPHFRLVTGEAHDGQRLDEVLGVWLAEQTGRPLSRSTIRRLVMAGAVRLEGRPLRRPGLVLATGQRLEARVDLGRLDRFPRDVPVTLEPQDVLFEDAWLIAVAKPSGLPFHATADPSRPNLLASVARFLVERDALLAPPYLGVHQRLDHETSGVVLLVKDPRANAGLARAFAERRVTKVYQALTARPPRPTPRAWTIEDRLAPQGRGRSSRMGSAGEAGVPACTDVRVARTFRQALLIEARPRTGRKHQIRAHLAGAGLPILGDARYGGPSRVGRLEVARALLHACRLELPHPVTEAPLVVECPYPADFRRALDALAQPTQRGSSERSSRRP
jgi:23S rRNA pseudouridine1911/1915/1917 synthase